jgi:hypothetical protein
LRTTIEPFDNRIASQELHMNGRTIVNIALGAIVVALLVGIGIGVYNAGISQGILEAGRVPAGAEVPAGVGYGYGYGYGWGHHPGFFGIGIFGLIFPILFILLLVGLFRAASGGWRRGWGGPGWGPGGPGRSGYDGWREERERQMAGLHKRLHEEEAGRGQPADPGAG